MGEFRFPRERYEAQAITWREAPWFVRWLMVMITAMLIMTALMIIVVAKYGNINSIKPEHHRTQRLICQNNPSDECKEVPGR